MSAENFEGRPAENSQICPKCGAPIPHGMDAAPGSPTCDACGAPLVAVIPGAELPQQPEAGPQGRNPLALAIVAIVAAGMLFIGFHMSRRSGPIHPLGLAQSTPAPDFTLESLDGKNMRLSDFRGKAVLLNFWATWCGPCKIEMPWFVELQREYGAQGFQIVGVAMDDSSKEDIAKFAQDMGVNYPVLLGKEAVGEEYGGVPALPESFFIGRDGKIVDKIIGLRGRAEIEDAIKRTLETPSASVSSPETMRAQN